MCAYIAAWRRHGVVSRASLLLVTVLLLLLSLTSCALAAAAPQPKVVNVTLDTMRQRAKGANASPVLRCLDDLKRICMTDKQDAWQCMMQRHDEIDDEACRTWVAGLRACDADARRKAGCLTPAESYIVGLRRCVRNLDAATELSDTCKRSRFYVDLTTSRYRHLAGDLANDTAATRKSGNRST